jgi:protein-disulfide isomerase
MPVLREGGGDAARARGGVSAAGADRVSASAAPLHEHARLAAKASLAAEAQGRFWEYHDLLVAHRDALDRASLEGCARTAGLDLARFGRDIDDPRFEARITADETPAAKLHVEGTPTAFVNGRRIVGAQLIAVYRAAVDRALARK